MRVLPVVTLLVLTCVLLSQSALIPSESEIDKQLFFYKEKSEILYHLLEKECPDELTFKRAVIDKATELEVTKLHYQSLLQRLTNCRANKISTTPQTTTKEPAEITTTTPTSDPCLLATELSDSWRLDHDGKNIKPGGDYSLSGYACDLHHELGWFRFTGAAGRC